MSLAGTAAVSGSVDGAQTSVQDYERALTQAVAVLALFLIGFNARLFLGFTTASVVTFALLPLWWASVGQYRRVSWLLVLFPLTVVNGVVLALLAPPERAVIPRTQVEVLALCLTAMATIGLVLWARRILPVAVLGSAYALGALLSTVPQLADSPNAWKYQLSTPVTILLLSLAGRGRQVVVPIVVLLGLAAMGALSDSRSYLAFCMLAVALLAIQAMRGQSGADKRPVLPTLLTLAALGIAGYYLLSSMVSGGFFGSDVQERSLQQIRQSGSLISGGRPEWAATWELMKVQPWGHGLGAVPNDADVAAGKIGMASVGQRTTNNGYIDDYMFGGQFELHSIVADFWSHFGVFGLLFGISLCVLIVMSLAERITEKTAHPLVVFMGITAVWYLAFGPMYSNLPEVALAVGLVLPLVTRRPSEVLEH